MKSSSKLFLSIALIFISIVSIGQNAKNQEIINKALSSETIKNQFEVLLSKSGDYQGYKNIKHNNLRKFKINFLDSLLATDKKYDVANTEINSQKTEIASLKSEIVTINESLAKVTDEKDTVGLFGMRLTKQAYNVSLWSIIGALLATTLLLLFKYKSSNKLTKSTKLSFNEVEEEFETHKKKSLEREQVLRRKLQDEINRQRNV